MVHCHGCLSFQPTAFSICASPLGALICLENASHASYNLGLCFCHGSNQKVMLACARKTLPWSIQENVAYIMMLAEGKQNSIVVIGEKGKAQLQRTNRNQIHSTMGDMAKLRITFPLVSHQPDPL